MHPHPSLLTVLAGLSLAFADPSFATDTTLAATLAARFQQDRTGVCLVAAVIDHAKVERERYCAQPRASASPGFDASFEIGSVSKTMTAFLVAQLIDAGQWSLDDPIAKHLPAGTSVPRQGERQITVRDLVTHSSGLPVLPPGFAPADPANPYVGLSAAQLLAALGQVQLKRPIGSQVEYSNFGMMVLSLAVADAYGGDLEQAFRTRLFTPLKMQNAFIAQAPQGQAVATGHLPSGQPTPAWTITPKLAGVGMVRASLDDMVRYVQAELDTSDTSLARSLRRTQQALAPGFAMNWQQAHIGARDFLLHEGGTGGFSSFVAFEPAAGRGVVVLADTALSDLGGLGDVGLPLLGLDVPEGKPRRAQAAPAALRTALVGDWKLAGMTMRIWSDGEHLQAQVAGQPVFELLYDDHGDFYVSKLSCLLTPIRTGDKIDRFAWRQGGGLIEASRAGAQMPPLTAQNPIWRAWAGEYRLAPQFSLKVFEDGGELKIQGTGQGAVTAEVTGPDRIEVKSLGAVLMFHRDPKGIVTGLSLQQHGQTLEANKTL